MDTVEKIEEYLEQFEEYFFSSLAAATTDLPNVHEAVNRLWVDISRYGPGMPSFPEIHVPGLGAFQVPPPPPTPPPPAHLTWIDRSTSWVEKHPWTTSGIVVGVVGAGLLAGYSVANSRKGNNYRVKTQTSNERRQVVVILGGDTPLGLPLIIDLEKKGYIVIASVSTSEACDDLEHRCQGYVKALVLDPYDSETVQPFLRSLASTLSRKFPINSAGDPYASPSSHPYIHSVISLLTLSTSAPAIHAPLEHISLRNTYLSYLSAVHITPLQVIQALLPLLRTGPARSRDKGKKSIVVCLPATDARVGLPFASMQAMAAASTLRGIEVLRREINVAALTDKSESMKNIKVVVADVGSFDVGTPLSAMSPEAAYKAMEHWTATEKLTYGPAFASLSHALAPPKSRWETITSLFKEKRDYGVPRRRADVATFVDSMVGVVSGGRSGSSLFGIGMGIGRVRNWIRGDRFAIGAGANTYQLASHLPSLLLDTLLNIPHILIAIRNRLLPVQPFVRPTPRSRAQPPPGPDAVALRPAQMAPKAPLSASRQVESENEESGHETSETSSEADVESSSGYGSGVDSSWVSLNSSQNEAAAAEAA